jgi:hypothetical protein
MSIVDKSPSHSLTLRSKTGFLEDYGLTGSYSELEGSFGHSGLLSPDLSRNRTLRIGGSAVVRFARLPGLEHDTWETLLPKIVSKHYATFRDLAASRVRK